MLYHHPEGIQARSWREIEQALLGLEHVAPEGEGFRYHNPDTGVEASFLGYLPEEPDEVGLALSMPLPRAPFFAHEALPCAVQVARELRLQVIVEEEPREATKELLLEAWEEASREALAIVESEQGELPGCDGGALELDWEFLLLREELSRRHGRYGASVPRIEYLQHIKTGRVHRVARWAGLGPVLLPPVELVLLESPPTPLRSGTLLSLEELAERARRWIKDVPQPIYHRTFLERTPPPELVEIAAELASTPLRAYRPLRVDQIKGL